MEDSRRKYKEEFGISNNEIEKEGFSRFNYFNDKEPFVKKSRNNDDVIEIKRNLSRNSTRMSLPSPERRKSYQVRAMLRKTFSYQKRQMGTNLCCVGACPTMMIIVSFLLSLLLEHYLTDSMKSEKYEYCTNDYNGTFVLPGSPKSLKSDDKDVYIGHYTTNNDPCSIWYGTNDHFASVPYDVIPEGNELNVNRDTIFNPPVNPVGNYPYLLQTVAKLTGINNDIDNNIKSNVNNNVYSNVNNNPNNNINNNAMDNINKRQERVSNIREMFFKDPTISYITKNIIRPWGIVAINKNNTEKLLVGSRSENPANITMLDINSDNYQLSNKGYLDYSYSRYFLNMYDMVYSEIPTISFERLPFFEMLEIENEKDYDDYILARIRLVNKILSNTTFDKYTEQEKKLIDLSSFKDTNDAIRKSVDYMPYGGVYFEDINEQNLNYKFVISVGQNDKLDEMYKCEECEITPYMTYPGRGKRLLYFLTELSSSILRKITDTKASITQGFRSFPEVKTQELGINIAALLGIILYPWGVSFLLPIFVINLVKEKEERYLVMMNMNGMKSTTYYIFVYLTNLTLSIISMGCFIIAGMICRMRIFTETSIVILLLEFFVWANIQVVLAFVISFFFKRNGSALITSFLIVLLSIVLSLSLIENFDQTYMYFIWPPCSFYYILYKLSTFAVSLSEPAYKLHNFVPGDRIFNVTMIMIVDFIILCILALYFNAVIPQEYGSHKPWHLNILRCFRSKKNEYDYEDNKGNTRNPFYTAEEAEDANRLEDDDVKAERTRVLSGKYDHASPLIIKNIRKEYPPRAKGSKPHVAVHSVTFAVEEGVVFGLLGPNGAGKTTLIHSLIGVYSPTSGYAKLAGYNIQTDMDQVYKRIGICPQHDILWGDLTVKEHLLFYARLKGIPKDQEESAVQESMESVGLASFKNNLVKGLSGGEKRRLSIAIALVGDPKLIFLDEPTTGLDPDVRRLIWSILNEISSGRTIIITTHSMEEAEVLCHRIAIMSHGTMRCCNTQLKLKEKYGTGFRLTYSNEPARYRELKQFITSIIPEQHKVIRDLASNSVYEFIPTKGLISRLFKIIEQNKDRFGIIDWGISQSSLEEVFLSIISEDDADAN